MKTLITYSPLKLMALGLVLISCIATSCTSLQQTTVAATDDLYFTPSAEAATKTIASTNNKRSNDQLQSEDEQEYQDYQSYPDDRYLRLKVTNRNRWAAIDDFGYWNDPRFSMNMGLAYGGWGGGFGGWGGGFGGWGGGFGGWGGGFGGWGGWNPYFAGYWNPYRPIYYGGGVGDFPMQRNNYTPRALQTSAPALAAYRTNRNYNNANNFSNTTNGTTRYTGNPTLNSRFGNLLRRVTTNNTNTNQANSFDRPARYFNNGGFSNNNSNKSSNSNTNTNTNTAPSVNNNAGGRSGGFNSSGSAPSSRPPRGGN